jgi:redox-sensing transcriptional repressor
VIAVPPTAAQAVAERLVAAGVTSILNFAPTVVTVPDGVDLRKVDLSIELQILAFHEQRKSADGAHQGGARRNLRGAHRDDPVNPEPDEQERTPPRRRSEAPVRERSASDLNEVLPA